MPFYTLHVLQNFHTYLKISEKGLTQNPKCVAAPAADCILRGSGSGP